MRQALVVLAMLGACDGGARSAEPAPEVAQPLPVVPTIPAAFIALYEGASETPLVRAVLRFHDPVKLLPRGSFIASYSYDGALPAIRARVDQLAAIDTDRRILFLFDPRWDYSAESQRALGELRAEIDRVGVKVVTLPEMACIDGGPMGGRRGPLGIEVPVTTYEVSAPEISEALLP